MVADHARCWARRQNITDPVHLARAKDLRVGFATARVAQERAAREAVRYQGDGHPVILRALSDDDALFGITSPDPDPAPVPLLSGAAGPAGTPTAEDTDAKNARTR